MKLRDRLRLTENTMSLLKKLMFCAGIVVLVTTIVLAQTGGTDRSSRAEVASLAQHIVARTYLNPQTGEGFACLWFPWLYAIPEAQMFDAALGAMKTEKTARLTARFTPFQSEPLPRNGDMSNALFSAGHEVRFYYKDHPSQFNQDWDHPDAFSSGQHVATFITRRNLLSQINNGQGQNAAGIVGFFVNSAPLTFSGDFFLPDGKIYNFRDITPGGITVHILASTQPVPSTNTPPYVQIPFSGVGIHMADVGGRLTKYTTLPEPE